MVAGVGNESGAKVACWAAPGPHLFEELLSSQTEYLMRETRRPQASAAP
jgi:hypothetical protein